MLVNLDCDDMYPVYYEPFDLDGKLIKTGKDVEIPDDLWNDYRNTLNAFLNSRDTLADYLEQTTGSKYL